MSESDAPAAVTFKKPKRPPARLRKSEHEEDDVTDSDTANVVGDLKAMQSLRKRAAGVSATALAYGASAEEDSLPSTSGYDPLGLQSGGGIIDLKKLKRSDWAHVNVEENLKQTFSRESHLRDEDEEMRRYVEERLGKIKGGEEELESSSKKILTEDDLYQLPDRLKSVTSQKNEEMLSQQMLCGIPEVDLGIDAKIKNIEETEVAKLRLLKDLSEKQKTLEKATTANQNLAKELAKGYVQHDRYKIDLVTDVGVEDKPERIQTGPVVVVDEDTPRWVLMEKTPGGSNKRQLKLLAKPTDEQVYQKMKDKITKAEKKKR